MTTEIELKFKEIQERQATIDILLTEGLIAAKGGRTPEDKWNIDEIYQGVECNIGIASSDSIGLVDFPTHHHPESIEYLICIKGSIALSLNNKFCRIINMGECASIPAGVAHSTRPLQPNSKLAYVCIPKDRAFPAITSYRERLFPWVKD